MKRALKIITGWLLLGVFYFALEGVWRRGYAHIVMLPIGGLCGVLVGGINQIPRFYRLPVIVQAILGAVMTLFVEFWSGVLVNIVLGMNVWDYSGRPGNILGQVCVQYAALWLLLMPFAIWLEDKIRWVLWREGEPYTLRRIYLEFITGR